MAGSRWGWCGGRFRRGRRCRRGGTAENAACRSSKTKKAPLFSGAFFDHARKKLTSSSWWSWLRGRGRRRRRAGRRVHLHAGVHRCRGRSHGGSGVSAVAASSFLDVQAASARTAATRARRFIYDLLERQTWNKSPVRARGRGARFWRGRNFISSGTSVKGNTVYLPSRTRARLTH